MELGGLQICPTQHIPEGKEGLAKVLLDIPNVMVDVMVTGAVGEDIVQGVEGEHVRGVVQHSLNGREAEKHRGQAAAHARSIPAV